MEGVAYGYRHKYFGSQFSNSAIEFPQSGVSIAVPARLSDAIQRHEAAKSGSPISHSQNQDGYLQHAANALDNVGGLPRKAQNVSAARPGLVLVIR